MLFKSSRCILCQVSINKVSIPKNSRISRSVFWDAPRVLTWISSTKDESSSSGMLSISISVGNATLSLVAAIKDLSSPGSVLSTYKKNFHCVYSAKSVS